MRKLSFIILPALAIAFLSVAMTDPNPHGKDFKISCNVCHSSKGWMLDKEIYSFDHGKTAFSLTGQHLQLNCRSCHPTLVFTDAKTACIDCHTDMHYQTVGPDCIRCHTTQSWIVNNITELHERSRFPLLGAHRSTDCSLCHPSSSLLRFEPQGIQCYDCHQNNYMAAKNPDHVAAGISKDCIQCHSINSITWNSSNTDHSFFPLTQGHANLNCTQCHTSGTFGAIPNQCVNCHIDNYTSTTNPNHVAAGFPNTCADCHNTNPGWKPATFDHTSFPLTLGHAINDCNKCHNGNYATTPNTCVGCHQANYSGSTNPPHQSLNFPTTCADCHTTNPGWKPATFTIHDTYYPLTGGHTTTSCNSCHNGNYATTPNTCVGCHQANYTGSTNPPHQSLTFPTTCADCHTTTPGWKPATFTIHDTYYPLTGGHTTTSCNSCHNGNYSTTPNTCVGCHQANYNGSTNPPHQTANIPTTCADCHTTNPGWTPATFAIHNNYWPLTGAHVNTSCQQCHNGNYTSIPNTCIGCHQNDYIQTNNPPHASAQFPTDCQMCHTTTAWSPSTFNHDAQYFPIYSGKHAGTWSLCSDCHTNASNYQVFSCIDCHQHSNQNEVNNQHDGVSGYSYNSAACYSCHPTGSSGGKMAKPRMNNDNRKN
ncbi:MAG: hypothetical protein NTU98_15320 [Bacteroidetes bacterium]|nr:hypothetical protein [Bacteroidota bacterium]